MELTVFWDFKLTWCSSPAATDGETSAERDPELPLYKNVPCK